MKSRVEPSAQCRSSIASSTGAERPSRSSSASSASNRRPWRARGSSSEWLPVPPSSGSSSASALRVPAGRLSASASARPRTSGRSAPTSGAYGICAPPSSRHWPSSTRAPCSRARASNSRSMRVLPMPDSPLTNANAGSPPAARSNASLRRSSSAPRPTKTGEVTPSGTSDIVAHSAFGGRAPAAAPARGGRRRGTCPVARGAPAGWGTITGRGGMRQEGDREEGSPFPEQRGSGNRALQRASARTGGAARR